MMRGGGMVTRNLITAAVISVVVLGACGGGANETAQTSAAATVATGQTQPSPVTTSAAQPPVTTSGAQPDGNGNAPSVGSTIEGTAVAASSGGAEACKADPDGPLPAGLVQGAAVTIRGASSGKVIGKGKVTGTKFEDDGGGQWTCTFDVSATVSATPGSITVEVAGLTLAATLGKDHRFSVTVPVHGGEGSVTSSAPSTSTPGSEMGSSPTVKSTEAPPDTTVTPSSAD